jgi:hypothetical protein
MLLTMEVDNYRIQSWNWLAAVVIAPFSYYVLCIYFSSFSCIDNGNANVSTEMSTVILLENLCGGKNQF